MMTDVESRLARVEERVITLQDNYVQTRLAHEDLNQRIEVANITLGQMSQRFINVDAALTRLQTSVERIGERQEWIAKLVIGLVITALVGVVLSGAAMHVR